MITRRVAVECSVQRASSDFLQRRDNYTGNPGKQDMWNAPFRGGPSLSCGPSYYTNMKQNIHPKYSKDDSFVREMRERSIRQRQRFDQIKSQTPSSGSSSPPWSNSSSGRISPTKWRITTINF